MIPHDLAARLRLLSESAVQPVSATSAIHDDLPPFHPGHRFTARIESLLPDGDFRAAVEGRPIKLSLSQPARPGETLQLVVTGRSGKAVLAARAEQAQQPAQALQAARPPATLSRAGQLISFLLDSQQTAPGRATASVGPLLPGPSAQPAPLVTALRAALNNSGLFYESHQAQWVAGRLPVSELLKEPQGRHSDPGVLADGPAESRHAAGVSGDYGEADASESASKAVAARAVAQPSSPYTTPPADQAIEVQTAAAIRGRSPGASVLPPDLLPIVQQQLEAVATHQVAWQGPLWPGQQLHWEIEEGGREPGTPHEDGARQWTTRLSLTLPQLGEVAAELALTSAGVRIQIAAAADALESLRSGQVELAQSMKAAGMPILEMRMRSHGEAA